MRRDIDCCTTYHTVGLTETFKLPELCMLMVDNKSLKMVTEIFKYIVLLLKKFPEMNLIERDDFAIPGLIENHPFVGCKTMGKLEQKYIMFACVSRYGDNFETKQIILANESGKLPWYEPDGNRSKQHILYKHCEFCFKTENLMVCSTCNYTKYCNTDCQLKDWNIHKKLCADRKEFYRRIHE